MFGADHAAISFLEKNGYDVSYISGVDTDRLGASNLEQHKAFISVGHDEYWSGGQEANVIAARDAGVNLLFWSGNESYWKTRYEGSIADGTEYRTLVTYKESRFNASDSAQPKDYANVDPSDQWTGLWRDTRFVSSVGPDGVTHTAVGASPESLLTGQTSLGDGTGQFGGALDIPASMAGLRFWRDTGVSPSGATEIAPGIIGYEVGHFPKRRQPPRRPHQALGHQRDLGRPYQQVRQQRGVWNRGAHHLALSGAQRRSRVQRRNGVLGLGQQQRRSRLRTLRREHRHPGSCSSSASTCSPTLRSSRA